MRTSRMLVLIVFLAASLLVFVRSLTTVLMAAQARRNPPMDFESARPTGKRKVWGLMYYNTPFSLFPPNAAISLTDDNSTSFAARPAAFGPHLKPAGLSGQLWVGTGFGDDATGGNAELGCADIPGWAGYALRNGGKPLEDPVAAATQADYLESADYRKNLNADEPVIETSEAPDDSDTDYDKNERFRKECAEIRGKVALLQRGGCGFLEKVMWAQRRGAVAVIVGDNTKGGPLIQMFAHGEEVDNVTIPSVFTARTTAQLLSALTQPGSFIEDTIDDHGAPVLQVRRGPLPRGTRGAEPRVRTTKKRTPARRKGVKAFFSKIFRSDEPSLPHADDVRPPSSGRQQWDARGGLVQTETLANGRIEMVTPPQEDQGLDSEGVDEEVIQEEAATGRSPKNGARRIIDGKVATPTQPAEEELSGRKEPGLFSRLFGQQGDDESHSGDAADGDVDNDVDNALDDVPAFDVGAADGSEVHEGLWVTITPTSSASPFFDTLLVLVVSPLITLTVVYALLVLRARIRRRRWRAPKSVIEQLPVRTYHTVARSPTLSPRSASPAATPTTPLLANSARPRPRSRTTTGVPESEASVFAPSPAIPVGSSSVPRLAPAQPEKGSGASGFSAEWRKYMGRQVECVVCLEEYVDGVSRVMSLPCGHEFHADCITPWLTTRRRTCPICKGDVVRSLARGSSSGPRYEPYRDDSDGENDAEGSLRPVDRDVDLEQGGLGRENGRASSRQEGWLSLISSSLGSATRSRERSRSPTDRTR